MPERIGFAIGWITEHLIWVVGALAVFVVVTALTRRWGSSQD